MWQDITELRDSPLRWKTLMELSCWTGRVYEDTKSLCQISAAGVKAFLFLISDIQSGIVQHSGDNTWQQIVLNEDVIEMAGKKAELLSYLKNKHLEPTLPTKCNPAFTPWVPAQQTASRSMSYADWKAEQEAKKAEGLVPGSSIGSDVMRDDSEAGVKLVPGPQGSTSGPSLVSPDALAKPRPRAPNPVIPRWIELHRQKMQQLPSPPPPPRPLVLQPSPGVLVPKPPPTPEQLQRTLAAGQQQKTQEQPQQQQSPFVPARPPQPAQQQQPLVTMQRDVRKDVPSQMYQSSWWSGSQSFNWQGTSGQVPWDDRNLSRMQLGQAAAQPLEGTSRLEAKKEQQQYYYSQQQPLENKEEERKRSWTAASEGWRESSKSAYNPARSRTTIPKDTKAYEVIPPQFVEFLWQQASDFDNNFVWDETNKLQTFIIGSEKALENPSASVTWYCEWNNERKQYKRIPTVLEVDELRKKGGFIPVSPQEFPLIPNSVVLQMKIPEELVEQTKDRRPPQTQIPVLGGISPQEMIGYIGQTFNTIQEVRASMQHNATVVQSIEEFLFSMFSSTWQAMPELQQTPAASSSPPTYQ